MSLAFNIKSFFNSLKDSNNSDSLGKSIEQMTISFKSIPSIISKNMTIEGTLKGSGIIEIEGKVIGNIDSTSVVIREGGTCDGEINAESINIRGNFNGNIKAKSINIFSKAKINGTIESQSLSVEDGASVDAQFSQLSEKNLSKTPKI